MYYCTYNYVYIHTCISPIVSLFSTGKGSPRPPGSVGLGLFGVVVVNSTIKYSSGRGLANLVTSIPYSPLHYIKIKPHL